MMVKTPFKTKNLTGVFLWVIIILKIKDVDIYILKIYNN